MQKAFVAVAVCLLAAVAAGITLRFVGPEMINDAGVPIDVGYYGAPLMFDWNHDGAKDLICGQFTSGMIRFYPNLGPDTAPDFNGYSFLQADGANITLPSG
ncbi:hypothetical protein FJY70_02665 [candidate division WOR-3 bacterium]|nr:hypothetical protein [candidate division WOR-3 bacterium]